MTGRPSLLPPPRRRLRWLPVIAIVVALAAVAGLTVKLTAKAAPACESSFVPAFFSPSGWDRIATGGRAPAVIILNPASGPGTKPDPVFQAAVDKAKAGGTTVIGYIGTEYGQRSAAQVKTWVHDYRDWYGVTGIFLDQTPTEGSAQLGYYQDLAGFIRSDDRTATIWLNPGAWPDRSYMSVGNVVMVFEGPFSSYLTMHVPAWARHYSSSRFAHTVYATPGEDVGQAVQLSRSRNASFLFLTDNVGSNPYAALPSYWGQEQSDVAGGCK